MEILKRTILFISLVVSFFVAPSAHAGISRPPNNLGLVGYWSMEDCHGLKATDSSGRGNTGTLTNFALSGTSSNWVAGKRSACALNFDGSNDFVDAGSPSSLNISGALTISLWVRPIIPSVGEALILNGDFKYGITYYTNGSMYFYINSGANGVSAAVTQNVWHHVVGVWDGTTGANGMKLYSDGVLVNQRTSIAATTGAAGPLYIGKQSTAFFGGTVDDIRLYNRALTAAEVSALYNSGASIARKPSDFVTLNQTNRNWVGMTAAPNGNVYAAVDNGDIYMQTNGTGLFNPLSQTSRLWRGMAAAPNGNIYAVVTGGDIYMQTNGAGTFNPLSQTSRSWRGIAVAPNGNVYATVDNGDIYMQTNGTGTFNPLSQTSRLWYGITADPSGNIYASAYGGDVYMRTRDNGPFTAQKQTSRDWQAMAATTGGNIYNAVYGAGIYMRPGQSATMARSSNRLAAGTSLASGLVGHWTFDGQYLTTASASDTSGLGNGGSLRGANGKPVPTQGILGQALKFDGVDDYVSATKLTSPADISVSMWVYPTTYAASAAGHNQRLFHTYDGTNQLQIILSESSAFMWGIANQTGGIKSTTRPTLNQWTHVTVTRSGATYKIYYNAAEPTTSALGVGEPGNPSPTTQELRIGADIAGTGSNGHFTGYLDDVRVYNRALSATEIGQLYRLGR